MPKWLRLRGMGCATLYPATSSERLITAPVNLNVMPLRRFLMNTHILQRRVAHSTLAALLAGLCLSQIATAQSGGEAQASPAAESHPVIEQFRIVFPSDGYEFRTKALEHGIEIKYDIVVRSNISDIVPLPQTQGSVALPGPSKLMPLEKISGNGQFYCILDVGSGKPNLNPIRIKKGSYTHSIKWDGKNWERPV